MRTRAGLRQGAWHQQVFRVPPTCQVVSLRPGRSIMHRGLSRQGCFRGGGSMHPRRTVCHRSSATALPRTDRCPAMAPGPPAGQKKLPACDWTASVWPRHGSQMCAPQVPPSPVLSAGLSRNPAEKDLSLEGNPSTNRALAPRQIVQQRNGPHRVRIWRRHLTRTPGMPRASHGRQTKQFWNPGA